MHFEAFELAQSAKQHQQKLLYLCASDKEARLIKHELKLYLAADTIGYYPEREILPYDRFSTPQSILQDRIGLLNSNKTSLQVVVTSGLNLLEKLPPKEFFSARKVLTTGQKLSIKELTGSLWMASLPLDRSEPSNGSLKMVKELNRLRELRIICREWK